MGSDARAPGGVHEILAALEALGVRVSLSDDDRIELRGTQAPTELRRALIQHGAQAQVILARRRNMREVESNAVRLPPRGAYEFSRQTLSALRAQLGRALSFGKSAVAELAAAASETR